MTPKEKAEGLVSYYKLVLMDEDTECGQEILCTLIAIKCALIAVDEIIEALHEHHWQNRLIINYWEEVKHELTKQKEQ
jgi:hypothetical protein